MMTKTDIINSRVAKIWKDDEGIIWTVVQPGANLTVDDMKEIAMARYELAGQKKVPSLVDLRGIKSMSQKAREYIAGPEGAKAISGLALLTKSKISEIFGNLFKNFSKPRYPTRIFTSEEEALEWLRGFLE